MTKERASILRHNLHCMRIKSSSDLLQMFNVYFYCPTARRRRVVAGIAQGAVVTGATLPSGLKVPQIHKKNEQWMVFGKSLVLVYKENEFTKLS